MACVIPRRELHVDVCEANKISSGATSTVYHGTWRGTKIAMKVMRGDRGDKSYDILQKELVILKNLRHSRILILMGVCEDLHPTDGGSVALITQLMERGTLYSILHETRDAATINYRPRHNHERFRLALDVSEGMAFLHNSHVVHRDLKSPNVLIDCDGRAKVADFGLSSYNQHSMSKVTAVVGTYAWTAPEVIMGNETMGLSADVYSFGVILWELFTGQVPWEGLQMAQVWWKISQGERSAKTLSSAIWLRPASLTSTNALPSRACAKHSACYIELLPLGAPMMRSSMLSIDWVSR
jgi:serine/threonine protein kinase